jgi:hypothetical protein
MAKSFKDLLVGDFIAPNQAPPVDVLNELSDALYKKVQYKLEFEISSTTSGEKVTHSFRVVLQKFGNYTAELFKVSHKVVDYYPVRIIGTKAVAVDAPNEDALREELGAYITSDEFQKTIGALLAQT